MNLLVVLLTSTINDLPQLGVALEAVEVVEHDQLVARFVASPELQEMQAALLSNGLAAQN